VRPARESSIVPRWATIERAVFGEFDGVLVGLPTAEVDGRHVAHAPRRIAGKHVGLANQKGRESMSEAGLRRPNRGISGGPRAKPGARAKGRVSGTC
jgi:hypothetical protein